MSDHEEEILHIDFFDECLPPYDAANASDNAEPQFAAQNGCTDHAQHRLHQGTESTFAPGELEACYQSTQAPDAAYSVLLQQFTHYDAPEVDENISNTCDEFIEQNSTITSATYPPSAMSFSTRHLSAEINPAYLLCGTNRSLSEVQFGTNQTSVVKTTGSEGRTHVVASNASSGINVHPRLVELEERPSKRSKTEQLLGRGYRVLENAATTASQRRFDRENSKSVRERGGQCLKCIFLKKRCSAGCPCSACAIVNRGIYRDLGCVRSDYMEFNIFEKGYPQLQDFLSSFSQHKKTRAINNDFFLCFSDMFIAFDKTIDPNLLNRLISMVEFAQADEPRGISFMLQVFDKFSQKQSAAYIFLLSSCLLSRHHHVRILYPNMIPFLQACRAFSSTCLFKFLDRVLRGQTPTGFPLYLGLVPQKLLQGALSQFLDQPQPEGAQNGNRSEDTERCMSDYLSNIAELFRRRGLTQQRTPVQEKPMTITSFRGQDAPSNSTLLPTGCNGTDNDTVSIGLAEQDEKHRFVSHLGKIMPRSWTLVNEMPETPILNERDLSKLASALEMSQMNKQESLLFIKLFTEKTFTLRALLRQLCDWWIKLFLYDQEQPFQVLYSSGEALLPTRAPNTSTGSGAGQPKSSRASTIPGFFMQRPPSQVDLLFSMLRCLVPILLQLLSIFTKHQLKTSLTLLLREERFSLGARIILRISMYQKHDLFEDFLDTTDDDFRRLVAWIHKQRGRGDHKSYSE